MANATELLMLVANHGHLAVTFFGGAADFCCP
jgi:hypothetical protein